MAAAEHYTLHRPGRRCRVLCRGELDPAWREFVPLFDSAWDMEAVKVKKSRKAVIKYELDGRTYYVKIYSRRHAEGVEHNLLRGSSLAFLPGKALHHLRKALALKKMGISAAQPCMVIERRYGLLRQESMLVTPRYRLPVLKDCLKNDEKWKEYIPALENVIRDIAKMHENGYAQRDPHFGNVLVTRDLGVVWLDFGTVRRCRFSKKTKHRDLRKLYEKSVKVLRGRVGAPGEFAAELLRRNYRNTERLQAALKGTPVDFCLPRANRKHV